MIQSIYLAIANRLSDRVKDLKTIDLWNDQPANLRISAPMLPACYVEFSQIEWEDIGNGCQSGDAAIRIWIVQNSIADSRHRSKSRDKAMDRLKLLTEVHVALQGFAGEGFGSLSRRSTEMDHDHDHILVYAHIYHTRIKDDSAATIQYVDWSPVIKVTGEEDKEAPARVDARPQ